jgi:predicted TIM-barrel fold metal-dependent hydrolase
LAGRIDHQYKLSTGGHGVLPKPPSEYLRTVYIDTAQSLYKPAMQCALSFTPIDKILFGSDDPFVDLKQSVASVKALGLPRDQEDMIFAGNARSLGII